MSFGSKKQQTVRYAGIQSIGFIFGTLINLPLQYLVAVILGPTGIGGLRIINLVKKYASYSNFGLIKGYRKQYVEAVSEGNEDVATQIDQVGFTGLLFSTGLSLLIVGIIYAFDIDVGGTFTATAAIIVCLTLIAERLYSYITVRTQSHDEFDIVGRAIFLVRIVTPIYTFFGLIIASFNGILVALLLAPAPGAVYLWRSQKPLSLTLQFDGTRLWSMFREGGWQYVDGIFTNLILTMGLALSVFYLNDVEIGLYAFADGIFTATLTLPASLQIIYFNNMVNIRKRAGNPQEVRYEFRRLFGTPLTMFVIFTLAVMMAKYLGYAFLLEVALPDFEQSLPLMSILLFGQSIYVTQTIATQYFVATDQIRLSAMLSLSWAIITYLVMSTMLNQSPEPITLALGSMVTLVGYTTLFMFVIFFQTRHLKESIWLQLRYLIACFIICGVLIAVTMFPLLTPDQSIVTRLFELVLEMAIALVVLVGTFSLIFADQNIAQEMYKTTLYLAKITLQRLPFMGSVSDGTQADKSKPEELE